MGIEVRILVTCSGGHWIGEEVKSLWKIENILPPNLGGDSLGISICKDSLSCALKICVLYNLSQLKKTTYTQNENCKI